MTDVSSRVVLTIAIVVTGVGALDAYIGRKWDLVAVFVFLGLLLILLWLRQRAHRVPVDLRPDLARHLESQSQRSGEPFEDRSAHPLLPIEMVEKVVDLDFPPGNVAVSATGRVFFTAGNDLDRYVVWDYVSQRRDVIA